MTCRPACSQNARLRSTKPTVRRAEGGSVSGSQQEIAAALSLAARQLSAADAAGDHANEQALAIALATEIQSSEVERRLEVPGWDPQPGNTDVWARNSVGDPRLVIETKLKASNNIY